MSVRPRIDRGGREPKEHCLNLDEGPSGQGSSSRSIAECNARQSVDMATSPLSFNQCKLVDIMEINSKSTKDILGQVKKKLLEACSALHADYQFLTSLAKQIEVNNRRAENIDLDCDIIKLNVGGHVFDTSIETLSKSGNNLFTGLLSGNGKLKKNTDGSYFFDRDGVHFRHILNYMRHGSIPEYILGQCKHELLFEAEFYGIKSLVDYLNGDDCAAAKNEASNLGDTETCSYEQTELKLPAIIDETTGLLNKACISLDNDLSQLDIIDHRRYKTAMFVPDQSSEVIKLNVGGVFFQTNLATLMKDKDSLLVSLVTREPESCQSNDGFLYIDRDGTRFKHILNFLRDGKIPEKVFQDMGDELMIEADFFEISSLKKALSLVMHKKINGKIENIPDNETLNFQMDIVSENNYRPINTKNPFENRDKDLVEKQESCQNITRNLDSLKYMLDSQLSQFKDVLKEFEAGRKESIDTMAKRTEGLERTLSDLIKEDFSKKLQEVCREYKNMLNDSCNDRPNEIIDIKNHITQTFTKHINQNNARKNSVDESHNKLQQLITKTLQSGFETSSVSFHRNVVQHIDASINTAFWEHEFRMEQELIAHKLPTACAFGMSEILRKDNECKAHLHQFLIETRNTGIVQLIYSMRRHGEGTFHSYCDNKPPTMILVKDFDGNIFGGFTTRYWNKDHGCTRFLRDSDAFVFSLKNHLHDKPFLKESKGGCILIGPTYGPAFGVRERGQFKYDFAIEREECIAGISGGFKVCAKYFYFGSNLDKVMLAGCGSFDVDEMEVFTIEERLSSESDTDEDNDYCF